MKLNKPFILGVTAASSGAGKTTLIEKIIPALIKENIRVFGSKGMVTIALK